MPLDRVDFLLNFIDSDPARRTTYIGLLALLLSDGNTGIKRMQVPPARRLVLAPWSCGGCAAGKGDWVEG